MNEPEHPDHPDHPGWSTETMRQVSREPTLAAAALHYATLGIPVFPCVPGGKQPLTANGFHDATSSSPDVARWWRRTPEANIGLPTGARTGLVVVDVDIHHDIHGNIHDKLSSGYPAFDRARSAGMANGWGWLVRTPSGGLHAYYPATPQGEQRCWQAPSAHIDFRGDGGYVIAPPSRIEVDGQMSPYKVLVVDHHQAKTLDAAALRRFLEPPRRLPHPREIPSRGCNPEALGRWIARTPEGGRNQNLFNGSCLMAQNGYSLLDIEGALGPAAESAGLSAREIHSTVQSAYRIAARSEPSTSRTSSRTSSPTSQIGPPARRAGRTWPPAEAVGM